MLSTEKKSLRFKGQSAVLWNISRIFLHLVHLVIPPLSSSRLVTSKQEEMKKSKRFELLGHFLHTHTNTNTQHTHTGSPDTRSGLTPIWQFCISLLILLSRSASHIIRQMHFWLEIWTRRDLNKVKGIVRHYLLPDSIADSCIRKYCHVGMHAKNVARARGQFTELSSKTGNSDKSFSPARCDSR